ncbi:hypothetical protein Tco_0850810 [Tanacetum coccineum]
MLGKKLNKLYDPFLRAGLGYKNLECLKKAIAAQPKMYDGEKLHSAKLKIDSPDSEETLEDTEECRLKMRNKMNLKELKEELIEEKNKLLKDELDKSSSDSKDIQANLLKRIKILENDFKRSQAQSIDFELKLQHQKEKMACDVSWKSKLSTINDENQHGLNIKKELDELIEHVNQKTYTYADVRAQNQDLLITISELKNKLQTVDKGKNVTTMFDKYETSGTLLCVTSFPKNIAVKAKKVSNTKRDEVAEATILSLTLHKIALAAEAQENIAKVQEKLDEEEIEKMVEGDEDEESYASEFTDSMINDYIDDSGTRIEPGSHKEHSENVNDDDEAIEKEMKDDEIEKEEKNEDVKKTREVVKEKDNDEDVSHNLSSNKTISEELTTTVSPTTATTSKDSSLPKRKKSMIQEVLDHCNNIIPELTFAKTNEMINKDMPCLVNLAVNKDREVDPINAQEMISKEFATHAPKMIEELFRKHMQNTTLNIYPTRSSSTTGKSTADLQHQLYLNMKSKPQDQAVDPEL